MFYDKKKESAQLKEALLGIRVDDPLLSLAREKMLARLSLLGNASGVSLPEIKLLLYALRNGEAYLSTRVSERLFSLTPLPVAPIYLLSASDWEEAFLGEPPLALFDPSAQLIFIKKESQARDHLALHESLHSLQGGYHGSGYLLRARYAPEKRILLEGITESVTVDLGGEDFGFYKKERQIVSRILTRTHFSPKDLVFFSSEDLYRFLSQEIADGSDRLLQKLIAEEGFAIASI